MNTSEVKDLIAHNRMKEAIKATQELTKESELKNDADSISSTYFELERLIIRRLISFREERLERASITDRIQHLLDLHDLYYFKELKNTTQQLLGEISNQHDFSKETHDDLVQLANESKDFDQLTSKDQVKKEKLTGFKAFLEKFKDPNSTYSKSIESVKNGISIVRKMARTYNNIAQWVGMPQVPNVFT